MPTALSVNLNKVAHLRNTRHLEIPDVRRAALVCLQAGAQGLTVHPRPDERHIRASDVPAIAEVLREFRAQSKTHVEYNIEGNPFDTSGRFLELVRHTRPDQCTLVPDSPDQATSDHGFDVAADAKRLAPLLAELRDRGIRSSVFMDADNLEGIRALKELGADRIELYTEPYAAEFERANGGDPKNLPELNAALDKRVAMFAKAATVAKQSGLGVNAGHDLNLENLPRFLSEVPGVLEVSIGHALIGEAIFRGLEQTVRDYLQITEQAD